MDQELTKAQQEALTLDLQNLSPEEQQAAYLKAVQIGIDQTKRANKLKEKFGNAENGGDTSPEPVQAPKVEEKKPEVETVEHSAEPTAQTGEGFVRVEDINLFVGKSAEEIAIAKKVASGWDISLAEAFETSAYKGEVEDLKKKKVTETMSIDDIPTVGSYAPAPDLTAQFKAGRLDMSNARNRQIVGKQIEDNLKKASKAALKGL